MFEWRLRSSHAFLFFCTGPSQVQSLDDGVAMGRVCMCVVKDVVMDCPPWQLILSCLGCSFQCYDFLRWSPAYGCQADPGQLSVSGSL